jgi:hypothetical protein
MVRHAWYAGLWAGLVAHALLGCAAEVGTEEEVSEGEVAPVTEPIINGFVTTALPAIGRLYVSGRGGCTATLISSRVILTAAHCFGFDTNLSNLGTQTDPPRNTFASSLNAIFYTYNSFPPAGQQAQQQFSVRRAFMVGTNFGEKDLAIAEIDSDINPQYAPPIQVATSVPEQGAQVTGYGYGCTVNGGGVDNQKRQHGAQWQASTFNTNPPLGCPGDSGGPILDSAGKIIAVFSYGTAGVNDVHARPVTYRNTIDRLNAIYGNQQVCTSCPIVSLKTFDNVHYLQAPNNGEANAVINATPTAVGEWEQLRLVQFAKVVPAPMPSWVGLQARSGRWLGTAGNGTGNVKTSRGQIFDNEMFFVENRGLGKWSLKTNTYPTKYYITAENGGGGTVSSNRTVASTWETFAFPFP